MAKEIAHQGVWRHNRHDRKRGTAPPDCICHNPDCAEDLHQVGIWVLEGTLRKLEGNFNTGETEGGVVLEVTHYDDFEASIRCGSCDLPQPHLKLEAITFDPDAQPYDSGDNN